MSSGVGQHESSWGTDTGSNKNCVEMTTSNRKKRDEKSTIKFIMIKFTNHRTSDSLSLSLSLSMCMCAVNVLHFIPWEIRYQNQTNHYNGSTLLDVSVCVYGVHCTYTFYVPQCLFQLANIMPE